MAVFDDIGNNVEGVSTIQGTESILDALEQLPTSLANKVIYKANLDIVAKVVRDPLKAALPYSPRTKRGIGVRKAKGTKTGVYAGAMSVAYWLRFLEKGTAEREGKRRGRNRKLSDKGRISPRPFIEPFINSKDEEVLAETMERYDEYITESLKKNLNRVNTKLKKL